MGNGDHHAGLLRRFQHVKEVSSGFGGGDILRHVYIIAYISHVCKKRAVCSVDNTNGSLLPLLFVWASLLLRRRLKATDQTYHTVYRSEILSWGGLFNRIGRDTFPGKIGIMLQ